MTFLITVGLLFLILIYIYVGVFVLWVEQDCSNTKFNSLYHLGFVRICKYFCRKYPDQFYERNGKFWIKDTEISAQSITDSRKFNNVLDVFDIIIGMGWPIVLVIDTTRVALNKEL